MAAVATVAGADTDIANLIESAWSKLKSPFLEAAASASGFTKNHQGNPNLGVGMNRWMKLYKRSVHGPKPGCLEAGGMMTEAKGAKTAYTDTKHVGKHAIWLAKYEPEREEFTTVSPESDGVFHIAKHMDHTNRAIVGENSVHNDAGERVVTDKDKLKAWVWALC